MRKKLLIALPLASVMMFSGCATLFGGGGKQTISVSSDSTKRMKAVVSYADGSSPQYLTIPGTITVKRTNKDIIVKSQDKDFEPTKIKKNVNGWFWANILGAPYGTILSSTTDYASGAMWKYDDAVTVHEK
jgi:hypothetical protein